MGGVSQTVIIEGAWHRLTHNGPLKLTNTLVEYLWDRIVYVPDQLVVAVGMR